ncbi:MAG: CPBP family glutamic-type intramembrane protease [Longimicrobiales bacterium]
MSDLAVDRTRANRTYWLLVALLALLSGMAVLLPGTGGPTGMPGAQELPAPRPVMALVTLVGIATVYGGLGYLGLRAVRAVDFAGIWDEGVSARQRFALPATLGVLLGLLFIAVDNLLAAHNGIGALPHPPFPISVVASITAAIGEEIIFRLFLVGGGYWLLSRLVKTPRGREGVFWAVALFSAGAFTSAHLPSFLYLVGEGDPASASLAPILLLELLIMNGFLSLVAAVLLRRYGLLAAIGVHFWVDIFWHVIWGGMQ